MKNILVTGGAGYVGSHTCKLLQKKGYNPVTFDNLSYGHKYAVKWGDLIVGDLNNFNDIDSAIKHVNPVGVIHCAAYTYVGESVGNPAKYYQNNVVGSLNLLNAMIQNNVMNLIFSSTCAIYGNTTATTINEETQTNPISPYGQSKLMVEKIITDFNKAYGLKSIIVRYFNVCGADEDGEIGEDHNPETHLIPLIIDVAMGKSDEIKLFGNNYNTPDKTCIRDYIHAQDLANAHYLSFEYLLNKQISNDFNLGTGKGYSVLDIIKAVEKVSNKSIKINIQPPRDGDPAMLVANNYKALHELKWKPTYDNIIDIVQSAYNWHNKQ